MHAMIDHLAAQSYTFPQHPTLSGVGVLWCNMIQEMVSSMLKNKPQDFPISNNSGFQECVFEKNEQGEWVKESMRYCFGRRADQKVKSNLKP